MRAVLLIVQLCLLMRRSLLAFVEFRWRKATEGHIPQVFFFCFHLVVTFTVMSIVLQS
jgi:hypothetical protein